MPQSSGPSTSSTEPSDTDFGANEWLVEEMRERYAGDPASVDPAWKAYFAAEGSAPASNGSTSDEKSSANGSGASAPKKAEPPAPKAAEKAAEKAPAKADDKPAAKSGGEVSPKARSPSPT